MPTDDELARLTELLREGRLRPEEFRVLTASPDAGGASGDEPPRMGYSLCMLRAGGRALNGYHRDPYLLAIHRELGNLEGIEDAWFIGYESEPRRLRLERSGASIRCVPAGIELGPPAVDSFTSTFERAATALGADHTGLIPVAQATVDGDRVDTEDRIQIGAAVLRHLLGVGL